MLYTKANPLNILEKIQTLFLNFNMLSTEGKFLLSAGRKRWESHLNITYTYIDDVLSINNQHFKNFLGQMTLYPLELEAKGTTESNTTSVSLLDLLLSIGRNGQVHTFLYDKHDDFNFHIKKTSSSLVATSHLHPPSAVLSSNSCHMQENAPLMGALFLGRRDFAIQLSGRTMSKNVWKYL